MSEIIRDKPPVGFSVTFGRYSLSPTDEGWHWLTNEDGEGMQIWNEEIERMFEKHFDENF